MPDLNVIYLVIGLILGHLFTRKGRGDKIMPQIPKVFERKAPEEHVLDNDLVRCQYSKEEEEMMREGKIPTRRG
jgi:hypothetical protein